MKQFDVRYVLVTPQMIARPALTYAKKAIPMQPIITGGSTELYRVNCPN